VTKVFLLVVSLWGFNGSSWVYTGNQTVLSMDLNKEQCEMIEKSWTKFEKNPYFRFSIECIEDLRKNT
jgi:hypothetical protein